MDRPLRRYEIILNDEFVGVWSGENKAEALDAYAQSKGFDNFQSAMLDWKNHKLSVIAVGSQPVIIEDQPASEIDS